MREIKFRGKRVDNREWVYGSLLDENHLGDIKYGIYFYDRINGVNKFILVDKNTIGQFTGLKDKNGVDIYEGDILKAEWGMPDNYVVDDILDLGHYTIEYCIGSEELEVIGNIHENEL